MARDAQGTELDRGSVTSDIVAGKVNNVTLRLGLAPDDMAANDAGDGDGSVVLAAKLSINNSNHDYGTLLINTTQSASYRITNTGKADSGALTTALSGANAGEFMISTDSCMGSALVGSSLTELPR